jgi:hypothetical protein
LKEESEMPISNEDPLEAVKTLLSKFDSAGFVDLLFVCPSCKVRREFRLDRTQLDAQVAVWCIYCKQSWDVRGHHLRLTLNPRQPVLKKFSLAS